MRNDEHVMKQALESAKQALSVGEVPIGAVVIDNTGELLGSGHNMTEALSSQSRHAEIIALEQAGQLRGNWRLTGCSLYVTVQPCLMCIGLICLSRIERLVWGTESFKFGCPIDNTSIPRLYLKHIKEMKSGVLSDEALQLMQQFFKPRRRR